MTPKRSSVGLICLALLAAGCTTTTVLPAQAPQGAYRAANDRLAGSNSQVRTTDGGLFELYHVQIRADSVLGLSPFGGPGRQFASGEVFEIRSDKDRTRGALIGGAIGAGLGLIFVAAATQDAAQRTGQEPVAGYALGTIVWGVIIGAIRGNRVRYRFHP